MKQPNLRSCTCIFLLLCFWCTLIAPRLAAAHPHVFVDNTPTFVFNAQGLKGVRLHWVFDDMFGTMIREDFDTDRDGAFSPAEVKAIENGAFANLRNFDWFTFIAIDGTPYKVTQATEFKAGLHNGKLFYNFFVPCPVPAKQGATTVRLRVQAPQYYADMYTPEESVPALEGADNFNASASVVLNPQETFSTFKVWCTDITLTFSPR